MTAPIGYDGGHSGVLALADEALPLARSLAAEVDRTHGEADAMAEALASVWLHLRTAHCLECRKCDRRVEEALRGERVVPHVG